MPAYTVLFPSDIGVRPGASFLCPPPRPDDGLLVVLFQCRRFDLTSGSNGRKLAFYENRRP